MAVREPVIESTFSYGLWQSLFLIKLHAFTVTGSEGVCDGVCFKLHALTESDFSKFIYLFLFIRIL